MPEVRTSLALQAGQIIAGRYRVERLLGRGGMGMVFAARHVDIDDLVAIKVMLPEVEPDSGHVGRFLSEARAARRIKSQHVVRVLDVGTLDGSGTPFMVMELLDGADFAVMLSRRGAMPVGEAVDYMLQACEALAEAHALGIVHRDLKPSNLFLAQLADGSPCVKVLDFGVAKLPRPEPSAATETRAVVGTTVYASPELLQSAKHADHRTDVWSIGVTLYELIAGQHPFRGRDLAERVAQILSMPPAPLLEGRPDVDPAIEGVIMRCLEKNRDQRYASVAELAVALGPLAGAAGHASIERVCRVLAQPRAIASRATVDTVAESAVTCSETVVSGPASQFGPVPDGVAPPGRPPESMYAAVLTQPPRPVRRVVMRGLAAGSVVGGIVVAAISLTRTSLKPAFSSATSGIEIASGTNLSPRSPPAERAPGPLAVSASAAASAMPSVAGEGAISTRPLNRILRASAGQSGVGKKSGRAPSSSTITLEPTEAPPANPFMTRK
jgi:tRNA A-37 threonylcarbamoyl transferase component Bud32